MVFTELLGSLQAQIYSGPLADLSDPKGSPFPPKINSDQYLANISNLVLGFEQAAQSVAPKNQQLLKLVQLQGNALTTQTYTLSALGSSGVIQNTSAAANNPKVAVGATSDYFNANLVMVTHLTLSRPLWAFDTPLLNYIIRTEVFQSDLAVLASAVPSKLTFSAADAIMRAEAAAYTADIDLSTIQRPSLGMFIHQQTSQLISQIDAAASTGLGDLNAFKAAIQTFTTATYDQKTGAGYLGPNGTYGKGKIQPTNGSQLPAGVPLPNFADANTFEYGRYKPETANQTIIYHRNYGGQVSQFGRYVTTVLFKNSQDAIRKSALDQTFLNTNNAFYTVDVKVPASVLRYVGKVAPIYQGVLHPQNTLYPGLGPQVLLSTSRSPVSFQNLRVTGS